MQCKRCDGLCGDDGDGEVATVCLYYDYQTQICLSCLSDYLLHFMPDLARLEIETDVLDAMMRSKGMEVTAEMVRGQSTLVNGLAQELVKRVIMWVRAGN